MTTANEIALSDEQQRVVDAALRGQSFFLTGAAGSGKSVVLRHVVAALRAAGRKVAVTGSTGAAAVLVGGTTIHSFLGTGTCACVEDLACWPRERLERADRRIAEVDTVIVDEVSMLSGRFIDLMDWRLRSCGACDAPFGGKQVVFVGDFFQLPPVATRGEAAPFAFEARAWQDAQLAAFALTRSFRQTDAAYVAALNAIRTGEVDAALLRYFNARVGARVDRGLLLFATNREASAVNERALRLLTSPLRTFTARYEGTAAWVDALQRAQVCEHELQVAVGARVICTYNAFDRGYVNGTVGTVVAHDLDAVRVRKDDGTEVMVVPAEWDLRDAASQRVLARVRQMPLRLAWALTVHRSQGMTLDGVVFEPARVFECSQAYVALSRLRALDGLALVSPLKYAHVRVSDTVIDWHQRQGLLADSPRRKEIA